jgi:hypothetical protein
MQLHALNNDLVIWQTNNAAVSLRSALGEHLHVRASGCDWYQVEIKRMRQ